MSFEAWFAVAMTPVMAAAAAAQWFGAMWLAAFIGQRPGRPASGAGLNEQRTGPSRRPVRNPANR